MLEKNLKPSVTEFLVVLAILLTAFVASSNLASASGGSISQANSYPKMAANIVPSPISLINLLQLTLTRLFQ
jgi:hypothetical protein